MAHGEENQFKLTHFQQTFAANKLILNQNPQCDEASNSKYPANAPLPVAEPWFLPGIQQTFGQRNAMVNQISYPSESSQTEGLNGRVASALPGARYHKFQVRVGGAMDVCSGSEPL
ncbi:hypothetical protein CEXT_49551 [Caerostris extrusa]|uniref:Uncharacterized protein n=1 Tax=Caerostris extrusa TaxID=172846 RepID=A0AAV4VC33_CAEEX|nr:hypothetical protein CEXT_49551 [Caerostris extrusa]